MSGTPPAHGSDHVVRRLEAFSDIVIGFSLAQLGLSLVVPSRALDFVQRPVGLVAFMVTFFVVARFWWTHFRLFRTYFEANRVMTVLNFIALAALIVQVFSLQLFLRFVPLGQGMDAARIYFAMFALSYGTLGTMFALGLIYRRDRLSATERATGIRDTLGILGAVVGSVIGNVMASGQLNIVVAVAEKRETVAVLPMSIFLGTFVGWIAGMACGAIIDAVMRKTRREPAPLTVTAPGSLPESPS